MKYSEHDFIPYAANTAMPRGRTLVLAPHPDDEVLGCGGAIMRHVAAGDPIRVIIVTDGALGLPPGTPDAALTRQRESLCAAAVLGYGEPVFWGLPDRGLEYGEALIQRILGEMEDAGADLVYAPSWWEIHPDHLTLALATAEAVRRCPRPVQMVMYEVGAPLHPSHLLNIGDLCERKQAAMDCFTSQLAQQAYDRHIAALNVFRTYTLPAEIASAEAYRLIVRDALREDPLRLMQPGPGHQEPQAITRIAALPPLSCVAACGMDIGRLLDALNPQPVSESEMARLQTALEQVSGQLEELRQSTSWRITAPLRWLVSHARTMLRSQA
ncbi:PIG-L deacetylase family protein [Thiobaca trueperi]|uniref:LmbE family N-acetylglucosaminyl deacetylase n=1 Tax=Thiobaca trueperi TaxID=127458 RepID=A0A4R3N1S8_9GAMM|nr:PIG-L deacetylase family protein [Thiobaca trueperi]TCT22805.1 LmbE family N-acetylglucosaminyl deacetylase [Thiobaca trueperi]